MISLGIETSCDETSVGIIDEQKNILSNIVFSQIKTHKKFGGVVPEVAAREHLDAITLVLDMALKEANLSLKNIDVFSATAGPGLIGGLIVGLTSAKALAFSQNKPFAAVNHLEGHLFTAHIFNDVKYPFLGVLISGGTTEMVLVKDLNNYEVLGRTLDDALGEAFDKTARILGYPYPGGRELEELALKAKTSDSFAITKMAKNHMLDFSFSGLKSKMQQLVQKELTTSKELSFDFKVNIASTFQNTIIKILNTNITRCLEYIEKEYNIKNIDIVVSGGVSANRAIRSGLEVLGLEKNSKIYFPPLNLCGDNGVMIAYCGLLKFMQNPNIDDLGFEVNPRLSL